MLKLEEFVNEKLKISKNYKGVNIKTTLRKFFAWYTGYNEFTINRFDLKDMDFISSDESMSKENIIDFLYKHINDEIDVVEEEKRARTESRSGLYNYSFDIEGITFNIDARLYSDELLSQCKDYIIEKLKVSKKSTDLLKIKLGNFITWYMFDNSYWDASDLQSVKFAIDTVDKYFNGSYNNLYDFINKHSKEVIYVYEEKINNNRYMYSFEIDGIPFNLEAYIENDSELLSKQWRLLVEKLKVTKNPIKGDIKSTMKEFFLWFWDYGDYDYELINDDFWNSMYSVEFENDVIEKNFNNMNEFLDWFEENMDDTVYFDEINISRDTYEYTFECDGLKFVINAYLKEDEQIPFSEYYGR